MKFAAALIALGAQAVKLYQEEDEYNQADDWETRGARVMSVIDWNGDDLVDEDELKDLIFIAETFGYIDGDEADDLNEFAEGVIDHFEGPISAEMLHEEIEWILEQPNEDGEWDEALEGIAEMEDLVEGAEDMMIDLAVEVAFDAIDADGSDAIGVDEVADMVVDLELDDEEAGEVYDAFELADQDGDEEVDFDEFEDAIWSAMDEDPELRWEILDEAADFINEFDVDCTEDGDSDCDNERAAFREEIAEGADEDEE